MNVAYLGCCPTQTAYTTYSIVNIAQTGPQVHFSVGPQRGRGLGKHIFLNIYMIHNKYTQYTHIYYVD